MKFVIVTHTTHILQEGKVFAYGPYVREMNLWAKYVDEIVIVAPISHEKPSKIHQVYSHANLRVSVIPAISLTTVLEIVRALCFVPIIKWKIFIAFLKADHIHLRCPGNIGLLGVFLQIFFPKKTKTAKYAGNWDPNSNQPFSYRLQKWLLSNTFLTRNMQVLVYGDWPGQSRNIKSFFTATYAKNKTGKVPLRVIKEPIRFIFVGSLVKGKRPQYAVKVLESLYLKGLDCTLDLYGDGVERSTLERYVHSNSLTERIIFHGNQTSETVEAAHRESHFLVLPSKSEGWPKVVAEAMFWGSIPIVSRISCVPWMLGNGERGILIGMEMEQDVAYILSLLSQPKKLNELRIKAQTWSQNYTLNSFEDEIKKLLK